MLDLLTIGLCTLGLIRSKRCGHSHPGVIYLVFHVSVFTVRAWGLYSGATPFLDLNTQEADHTLLLADGFLLVATLGWLSAPRRTSLPPRGIIPMSAGITVRVAIFTMPYGLYRMAANVYSPGSGTADRVISTSYQILGQNWPGLILAALIYVLGTRWYLLIPFAGYVVLMSAQGESRFRALLPLIFVLQIWMDRRGYRWPPPRVVVILILAVAIFIPLKGIGQSVRNGTFTTSNALSTIEKSTQDALKGKNSQQALFDQAALAISQSDKIGPQYGKNYLGLLALPIPRPWWPNKPGLAENVKAVSTPDRDLATAGTIVTVPGELYLDWHAAGMLIFGFLIARWSAIWYERAYRQGYGSVGHFFYLILAFNLIQIYRDGLISVPVFMLVQSTPLVLIVIIHHLFQVQRVQRDVLEEVGAERALL